MKNLLWVLLVMVALSCSQPADVIENYYTENGYSNVKRFVNQQIFPVVESVQSVTKSNSANTPAADHSQGIFYRENSKTFDDQIHTIDLGYLTGNNQALVYLEIKVIGHGYDYFRDQYDDEAGSVYIRGRNSKEQWKQVTPRYNQYTEGLLVLTGDEGKIEWYHEHGFNFWDNPTCEPGAEIYKWEKIVVNAIWLVEGLTVE